MRSARTEVSDRISVFPVSRVEGALRLVPGVGSVSAGTPFDAQSFMIESLFELDRRVGAGDECCGAARSLLPVPMRRRIAKVAADIAQRLAEVPQADIGGARRAPALSSLCYALAVEADASDRTDDAVLILSALVGSVWGELDGCLGLAVIALRRDKFVEALVLAEHCMNNEVRHPRVYCILGICLLEHGNGAAAQAHLAAAARLARTKPEFREDLQAAQRALLLMHLAGSS